MAATAQIPYIYIQCPCTSDHATSRKVGEPDASAQQDEVEEERNFDPRAPRSCYNLYPLDHLLFCEDCQQMRCPKCVVEELVTTYCPNCLFEVSSSAVKHDGNRCTRSCFQCPICLSSLSVSSLENRADQGATAGPFVLNCQHCNWNSKEIGVTFEKAQNIYVQLAGFGGNGWTVMPPTEKRGNSARRRWGLRVEEVPTQPINDNDAEPWHMNLLSFYHSQIEENQKTGTISQSRGFYGYASPASLSRVLGLYTSKGIGDKDPKPKASMMREPQNLSEGLKIHDRDDKSVEKLQKEGWLGTSSLEQRAGQPYNPLFVSDLRPIPYLLRTKRSKRCRVCKHILSKPESKVTSVRYRIRLAAFNYLPSMTITPLLPQAPTPGGLKAADPFLLQPLQPTQLLLTFRNPIFDAVKVTLATPSHTPGRFSSKVTILCPQFEIGANTDFLEEALKEDPGAADRLRRRAATREVLEGPPPAEAGKVWDRDRNWVSVVMEVVPASLSLESRLATAAAARLGMDGGSDETEEDEVGEDEDILEIPIFVRIEYEADVSEITLAREKGRARREKRELAYWCVLGVGRIAQV